MISPPARAPEPGTATDTCLQANLVAAEIASLKKVLVSLNAHREPQKSLKVLHSGEGRRRLSTDGCLVIQWSHGLNKRGRYWIPAFAGMTSTIGRRWPILSRSVTSPIQVSTALMHQGYAQIIPDSNRRRPG
jgi:hypothetical protein